MVAGEMISSSGNGRGFKTLIPQMKNWKGLQLSGSAQPYNEKLQIMQDFSL